MANVVPEVLVLEAISASEGKFYQALRLPLGIARNVTMATTTGNITTRRSTAANAIVSPVSTCSVPSFLSLTSAGLLRGLPDRPEGVRSQLKKDSDAPCSSLHLPQVWPWLPLREAGLLLTDPDKPRTRAPREVKVKASADTSDGRLMARDLD